MQLDEQAVEGIIRLAPTLEQGITRKKPNLSTPLTAFAVVMWG
jgi:hypothetical protein